mmetsp:Transcript_49560/g.118018  ORF Transcript_49560/g.118018 Transcript_49560/m.118018 type:complete len:188 (+) Transcript_49560:1-564(+)
MSLTQSQRDVGVPFAVRGLIDSSTDKTEETKMLSKALEQHASHLPSAAKPLVEQLTSEIRSSSASIPGAENSAAEAAEASAGGERQEQEAEEENGGTPFCIGTTPLPLNVMLNICASFEPEELTTVAGVNKSLCIAININLQYMYLLVRLVRLVVFGASLADDSSSTTSACDESTLDTSGGGSPASQ